MISADPRPMHGDADPPQAATQRDRCSLGGAPSQKSSSTGSRGLGIAGDPLGVPVRPAAAGAAQAQGRGQQTAAPATGQAPRARTAPRATPDAPMPARPARPPPGPSGKLLRALLQRIPAPPRGPPRPSQPRPRRWPTGSAPAGAAPACPGPRSPGGPAAATCRTPGSSAVRLPPADHRLCPWRAANRPQAPAHPPTARPAAGPAGHRTAARAVPNYAANPPATSAAHPAAPPRRTARTMPSADAVAASYHLTEANTLGG